MMDKLAKEILRIAEDLENPHYVDPRLIKDKDDNMLGETELDAVDAMGNKKVDVYHQKKAKVAKEILKIAKDLNKL